MIIVQKTEAVMQMIHEEDGGRTTVLLKLRMHEMHLAPRPRRLMRAVVEQSTAVLLKLRMHEMDLAPRQRRLMRAIRVKKTALPMKRHTHER